MRANGNIVDLLNAGFQAHQRGELNAADTLYRAVLAIDPAHIDALHLSGLCAAQASDLARAQILFQQVLQAQSQHAPACNNLANVHLAQGDREQAMLYYQQARSADPSYPDAIYNQALLLLDLSRFEEAISALNALLLLQPQFAPGYLKLGVAYARSRQPQLALSALDKAMEFGLRSAELWLERGHSMRDVRQLPAALHCYQQAIALNPDAVHAYRNHGVVLHDLGQYAQAVESYDQALQRKPDYHAARYSRALALQQLGKLDQAISDYQSVVDTAPETPFALGRLLHAKMLACDWRGWEALVEALETALIAGKLVADPFGYQAIATSEQNLLRCAQHYCQQMYPSAVAEVKHATRQIFPGPGASTATKKIRVGYVCGEFRQQATSVLMTQIYELHDRDRFEIYAFDNGWDDGSPMRKRIDTAMFEVVDIASLGDADAAAAIRQRDIDILVNLNGFFGLSRTALFALQPAPVQVNYLGFPGTMGCEFMQYLIADVTVLPRASQSYYRENIAYLPDCYQANDAQRQISDRQFTRAELGLPEQGFIFCCFNNNYKITPLIFDCWMRILHQVPGSVLWLLEDNQHVAANLQREAAAREVDPDRLVFAARMPLPEHLSRHQVADLFLDTWPYNAHTTASDALWAGVPLLTCLGTTFPGRVAASLLKAVGLPELIAPTLDRYVEMAIELASNPLRLQAIRHGLKENRQSALLFDAARLTQALEQLFTIMHTRCNQGHAPAPIRLES
jgi:predicted O-linked N-acetylglucosamine transferase (SPINDLY family)